jgi:acetyltransferase-like isoleucine patch superfamily enzyme
VHESCTIAGDVVIGAFTIIHPDVIIEKGVVIDSHCVLGSPGGSERPLCIGEDSLIRSHSVIQGGSVIGRRLSTGSHCTIRSGMRIGEGFQLGGLSSVEGRGWIGDYVKTQTCCQITPGATLCDYVQLFANVQMTNDPLPPSPTELKPQIGLFSCIASNALVMPGAVVAELCFVTAGSVVKDCPEPGMVYSGDPARPVMPVRRFVHPEYGTWYDWPLRFRWPEDVQERVLERYAELQKELKLL